MRVGIDASFIGTKNPTGLAVYTQNIVNSLAKIHPDVVVWAAQDAGFELPQGVLRKVLDIGKYFGKYKYLLRPVWMELVLPRLLKQEGVDLLFSTVPGGLRDCPVPHVVTIHDLTPLTCPKESPLPVRWSFAYRLPRLLNRAESIVAVSECTKKDLLQFFDLPENKIEVIGEGFDCTHFKPCSDPGVRLRHGLDGVPYVFAIGSANPRKNLERLARALGKVKNRIPHYLVTAGPRSSEQKDNFLKLISQEGLRERYIHLDYLSYEDLPVIYSGADFVAYVSLYEGFGLPVLEAMACGTPVLGADRSSIPEVAGDAAVLVDPEDVDAIATKLVRLATDEQLRKDNVVKGFHNIQRYSWAKAAKELLELFGKLSR